MGWKGALRSVQAEIRRAEREAQRRQRELERQRKHFDKMQELEAAAYEVEVFDNHLAVLTSVHVDCSPSWDWNRIREAPAPVAPTLSSTGEDQARRTLRQFKPGVLDRILGRAEKKRAALEAQIPEARQTDAARHRKASEAHAEATAAWSEATDLAKRIIEGEPEAYVQAIDDAEPFAEIEGLGSSIRIEVHSSVLVTAAISVQGDTVVPREAKSLLQSGKLSVKQMPKGRFFELYQDYVCGAALRVGRELLALLPIDMVVCHVSTEMLNSSTGHLEDSPILSVALPRGTIDRLNFSSVDPSDALANFVHHMAFKKTTGFAAVQPIDPSSFGHG